MGVRVGRPSFGTYARSSTISANAGIRIVAVSA
jgi:hypothetical protein